MRNVFFIVLLSFTPLAHWGQGVVASGVDPAWLLDFDGTNVYTLYQGENVYTYTLISKQIAEGSLPEIAESWVLKGERGKTAVLVIEYFDAESAESCPCFHDFGEGLNAGKAYFITENQQFFIGCAEYSSSPITSK